MCEWYWVENAGVLVSGEFERGQNFDSDGHFLPNFVRAIDDACFLSRRSAVEILIRSGRIDDCTATENLLWGKAL